MKLNNRGYMLVEIVLASAIAFGIAYFLLSMTVKLKNKNDDLVVETMTVTDETIIMNGIMRNLKGETCTSVNNNLAVDTTNKKISIGGKIIDIVNEYAKIGNFICNQNGDTVKLTMPLEVEQLPDKDFNIELYWIVNN